MKKLAFLICSFGLLHACFCQQRIRTQLSGTVTDVATGKPLAAASIMLVEPRIGTISDSSGNYNLINVPLGHTLIEVSHAGYRNVVEHVDVVSGNNAKNFNLIHSVVENEAVTVTAVGAATSIRKAPVSVTRITKSELLSIPATNIIDAISRQPGVNQISTGPAVSKPIIRGLGYNRLVVINDGVRQEGQQWGDEHGIEIDENSVSRVEIVKGPASLIYGSDALAGVVNIITTSPVPVNSVRGSLLSSYGTNNKQRSFYGNLGGNRNGFNWNAWGDYKAAADYSNKYDGKVWNSKFNERNFGGHAGFNGAWGFSHFIVSNFNQRLGMIEGERDEEGRFIKPIAGGGEALPSKADFNSVDPSIPYQHVRHFKIISDNSFRAGTGRLSLNIGWQRNQRQEFGNADDPGEKSLYFDLKTINYNAAYHFNDPKGWNTSIGFNGMRQTNENKGVEVLIPEYGLFDLGGFIYTQKTVGKTTVSGGARYDKRFLESEEFSEGGDLKFGVIDKSFSNVSASAGLSFEASKDVLFKMNLARGFRAPTIAELASNGTHEGTNRYEYGNENLKSETSLQGDIGFEINSNHLLFTASAFYNSINDFIFYSKLSSADGQDSLVEVDGDLIPAFNFNQRTARLYGFEMLLDLHPHPLDWLHWENTFSYVRAKFKEPVEGVENVPFIPAARWISELRAQFLPQGKSIRNLSASVELDRVFRQNNPFTAYDTETATPGYTLVNAGITANIMKADRTLFTLFLLGHNLADVAYQSHLSRLKYTAENAVTGRQGVFNMGRNFSFKLLIPLSFNGK